MTDVAGSQRDTSSDVWTGAGQVGDSRPPSGQPAEPDEWSGALQPGGATPRRGKARAVGSVANFKQRFESRKRLPTVQIATFRLELYDRAGNRVQPVPVEMRGVTITGHVADGERVEVFGRFSGGTLYASSVRNVTTGGGISTRLAGRFGSRLGRRTESVIIAVVVLMLVASVGLIPQVYINTPIGLHEYRSDVHGTCERIAQSTGTSPSFDEQGTASREGILNSFNSSVAAKEESYQLLLSHLTPLILKSRRNRVAALLPQLTRYYNDVRTRLIALPNRVSFSDLMSVSNQTAPEAATMTAAMNDAMTQLAGGACNVG